MMMTMMKMGRVRVVSGLLLLVLLSLMLLLVDRQSARQQSMRFIEAVHALGWLGPVVFLAVHSTAVTGEC